MLAHIRTIWWPAAQPLMDLLAMQGHTLPHQTRIGISVWSSERRQDLLSRFEVFSSRQEVSSFKNYYYDEKVIVPTGVMHMLQINIHFLKAIVGLPFLLLPFSLPVPASEWHSHPTDLTAWSKGQHSLVWKAEKKLRTRDKLDYSPISWPH